MKLLDTFACASSSLAPDSMQNLPERSPANGNLRREAKGLTLIMSILVSASLTSMPARAGFFDQLFGVAPAGQQAAPAQRQPAPFNEGAMLHKRHREHAARVKTKSDIEPKRRNVAAGDRIQKLQRTTLLMADKTLRPGDAIMLDNGIKIYEGPIADSHERHQFVTLGNARHVSKTERRALVAVTPAARDHDATAGVGRSIAASAVASRGYDIPDDRLGKVRYVGP